MAEDKEAEIRQNRYVLSESDLVEAGIDLAADFPTISIDRLRQYPVLTEGGWFIIIKDQVTLQEIARRPWRLLGPIELLSNSLALD